MCRSRAGAAAVVMASAVVALASCGRDHEMAETMEMPDSMEVRRALDDPAARDALLDTMPGGEMVRGASGAEEEFLRDKSGN